MILFRLRQEPTAGWPLHYDITGVNNPFPESLHCPLCEYVLLACEPYKQPESSFSGYVLFINRDGLHHDFVNRDITIRPSQHI